MSRMDEALRLFEELDGLNDSFIEEGMLPDTAAASGRRSRKGGDNPFIRFANSGWGVAIICAVVSLSVLTAIVRLGVGRGNEAPDIKPPNQNRPMGTVNEDHEGGTEPVTEEAVSLPAEADRVPIGQTSTDGEGLRYVSYGNGTCMLMGGEMQRQYEALYIPNYSPDGDVVVAINSYAFGNQMSLREVTLPAGLRSLDHKTFPMDAPIYNLHGNILYLGSRTNPYMVAISTADNRPGATALHPDTQILACHALTYDTGSYFAMAWADKVDAYKDDEVFSIPSGIIHIGEYALLDVGRDITYNGYLVGWDTLTAEGGKNCARTVDGRALTVRCLDGTDQTAVQASKTVNLDGSAYLLDGALFGSYMSEIRTVNEDYYTWRQNPEAFEKAPEQFIWSGPYGIQSRVLTAQDLSSVTFSCAGNPTMADFAEAYNRDPLALYQGKSVVMLYVSKSTLYRHAVVDVTVQGNRIHVTLMRIEGDASDAEGSRFILIPLDDPNGGLQGASVTFEIVAEPVPPSEN